MRPNVLRVQIHGVTVKEEGHRGRRQRVEGVTNEKRGHKQDDAKPGPQTHGAFGAGHGVQWVQV